MVAVRKENFINTMESMRLEVAKVAASKAPVDTGKLKSYGRSTVLDIHNDKISFSWIVDRTVHYAGFVIYGTGKKHRLKKAYNPAYEGKGHKPNLYPYKAVGEVMKKYQPKLAKAAAKDAVRMIVHSLSFTEKK